jgi:hypothetical protein
MSPVRSVVWLALMAMLAAWLGTLAPTLAQAADTSIPETVPWPIPVSLSVRVLDVQKISETTGELSAIVEYTSRWQDPRLTFQPVAVGREHFDFFGPAALQRMGEIWHPGLIIANLIGHPRSETHGLLIYAKGTVITVTTVEATFKVNCSMDAFPFDRQQLALHFITPHYDRRQVLLVQSDEDRLRSSVTARPTALQWHLEPLRFETSRIIGWNGQTFSRSTFWLPAKRDTQHYLLRIFVPFFAVMLGSFFVLWSTDTNLIGKGGMILSGVVALVALSFTFEASFPGSISMNSPISTLLSLGYIYLISIFFLNMLVMDPTRSWAKHNPFVFLEIRTFLRWSLPMILLVVGTALCIVAAT